MGELCETCTQFVVHMADPNVTQWGEQDFATCSEIEAAAMNCPFCKIFMASIRRMPTKLDSRVTLRMGWAALSTP